MRRGCSEEVAGKCRHIASNMLLHYLVKFECSAVQFITIVIIVIILFNLGGKARKTTQTYRHTDRQTDKQTYTNTNRHVPISHNNPYAACIFDKFGRPILVLIHFFLRWTWAEAEVNHTTSPQICLLLWLLECRTTLTWRDLTCVRLFIHILARIICTPSILLISV